MFFERAGFCGELLVVKADKLGYSRRLGFTLTRFHINTLARRKPTRPTAFPHPVLAILIVCNCRQYALPKHEPVFCPHTFAMWSTGLARYRTTLIREFTYRITLHSSSTHRGFQLFLDYRMRFWALSFSFWRDKPPPLSCEP